MKDIDKESNSIAEFGVVLEEKASDLTHGGLSGKFSEGNTGYRFWR